MPSLRRRRRVRRAARAAPVPCRPRRTARGGRGRRRGRPAARTPARERPAPRLGSSDPCGRCERRAARGRLPRGPRAPTRPRRARSRARWSARRRSRRPSWRLGGRLRLDLLLGREHAHDDYNLPTRVELDPGSRTLVDHGAVLIGIGDVALGADRAETDAPNLGLGLAWRQADHVWHADLLDTGGDGDRHGRAAVHLAAALRRLRDHLSLGLLRLLLPDRDPESLGAQAGLRGFTRQAHDVGHRNLLGAGAHKQRDPCVALDLLPGSRHRADRAALAYLVRALRLRGHLEVDILEVVDRLLLGQLRDGWHPQGPGPIRDLERHGGAVLRLLAGVWVLVDHLVQGLAAPNPRLRNLESSLLEYGARPHELLPGHAWHLNLLGGECSAQPQIEQEAGQGQRQDADREPGPPTSTSARRLGYRGGGSVAGHCRDRL